MMMIQSPMPFGADLFELADSLVPTSPTHSAPHTPSSFYHNGGVGAAGFGPRKPSIDQSKLKTKMCRHYLMGLQCPFEARCAFAHGEEQLVSDRPATHSPVAAASTALSTASTAPSSIAPPVRGPLFAPRAPTVESMPPPPPPPSYHAFVSQSQSMSGAGSEADNESPRVSRPPSPPAYPTRFRYEPYSHTAIVFQA